jgi:NAD(P)-dependent dehydrogenase (short-subunit alcohol dehydrogenase family)
MKQNNGGTIIIISSFFGTLGWNNATGYGASKSGLLTLGQYLDREYRKYNIRVCVIVPGVIDTPQLNVDATDLGISLDEVREMYAADIAMKRIAQPSEIADVAAYMATDDGGRNFAGRHLIVSGGEYRSTPYYI